MSTPDRENIIRMAREAGFGPAVAWPEAYPPFERLVKAAYAAGAAAEREARIEAQKRIEALQAENVSNEANRLAAVLNEREACERAAGIALLGAEKALSDRVLKAIRARGQNV